MKITHLASGEDYNLAPGTKIEVERTNPFFNEYGEQTTPLDLPASERNRRLLGFPDILGQRLKVTPMDVTIQDGEYFSQCRQIVLSAQHRGSIATSFYINDGSFYSRIQKTQLKDVFKDEFIPGVETVEQGIEFCRGLRANTNERYGIFPLLVEDDSGKETGFNYKIINAYGKPGHELPIRGTIDGEETEIFGDVPNLYQMDISGSDCDFYNAIPRTEIVEDVPIKISEGYYITPFIRANYLLKRVFQYFGYELEDNFFTHTEPFSKMVVLNKVIDTLVNGKIKVADLVPDMSCSDFLTVFRKKFCCEFTPDESRRTAHVIFLHEALQATPIADFTSFMVGEPIISYKAETDYQRLVLSSEEKVESEISESYEDLKSMLGANPGAYFNPITGTFYKDGFIGDKIIKTKIGEASQDYNTGEGLKPKEVKIGEMIPEFRTLKQKSTWNGKELFVDQGNYLYVGSYLTLNSKMTITGKEDENQKEKKHKQPLMLAFNHFSQDKPKGTITAWDVNKKERIFDYSLCYHGTDGIFNRFYQEYDQLLRNSLHDMKVKLLLSQSQKQNIQAHGKVVIRGVPFFLNKLKFTLGGSNDPVESELKTISLMQPISRATAFDEFYAYSDSPYMWIGRIRKEKVSQHIYNDSGPLKDRMLKVVYPPKPEEIYLNKRYAEQETILSKDVIKWGWLGNFTETEFTRIRVWLECIKRTDWDKYFKEDLEAAGFG